MGRPIVVAGGGIAGLATALALARAGQRVIICERDATPSHEGAGVQLAPNATRRLRDWGVLEGLTSAALAPSSVIVRRARDSAVLAELPLADAQTRWGAPFLIAHRADLHHALREAVQSSPAIEMRWRCKVDRAEEREGVVATFADGAVIEAQALIVADGIRSGLRDAFGPAALVPSGRVAWRSLVAAADAPAFAREGRSNLWLGADAHLVHYPLRGGSVVNIVAVTNERAEADPSDDVWTREGDAGVLGARFAHWHRDARDLLRAASAWRVWPLLTRAMPRDFARGRIALAGDAAHPMMPFLAQGAAQAIEDADALGRAFADTASVDTALATYAMRRQARARKIVEASARQAMIYHLGGASAIARDAAMHVLGPAGMRAGVDWIYKG
jgi:salicylate hydroxylase